MGEEQDLTALEDNALLLIARDDPSGAAFRQVYDRYRHEVFRFLGGLLRDRELAEDVLQETFFRVYKNLPRYDTERPFRPWLYRLARNAALNTLRSRRKETVQDAATFDGAESDSGIIKKVARQQDAADVKTALATLPDETRALLLQRHGLGLKLRELALSMECTERTVRNRLHSAGTSLAEALLVQRSGGGR